MSTKAKEKIDLVKEKLGWEEKDNGIVGTKSTVDNAIKAANFQKEHGGVIRCDSPKESVDKLIELGYEAKFLTDENVEEVTKDSVDFNKVNYFICGDKRLDNQYTEM